MRWSLICVLLFLLLCVGQTFAQPFTKKYLMAFHSCTTNCGDPRTHTARLVESDDGTSWVPVSNAPLFPVSVPDIIIRGDKIYLFSPGRVTRYDRRTNTWDGGSNVMIRDDQGQQVNFVDPSPLIDANGRIVLFFLRGGSPSDGDPASCRTYPCTKFFGSAVEVENGDGAEFRLQPGWRTEVTLQSGTIADPDIFYDGQRYVMYLSAGNSIWAYSSTELHGGYVTITGLPNGVLTNNGGGVPSGYYDAATGKYWTFAHTFQQGRTVIRRAVTDTLSQPIAPTDFTTIVTGATVGLDNAASVASPGFTLNTWLTTNVMTSVSAASFNGQRLAPESIVTAFGTNLSRATLLSSVTPLPATLAGTSLRVKDKLGAERQAPLFFVSPTQVNFQLPSGIAIGAATITAVNADGITSTGNVEITSVAPGLFAADSSGKGLAAASVLRVKTNGAQSFEPAVSFDAAQNRFVAVPIDLGAETDQVFLLLFGSGFRLRSTLSNVSVKIGGDDASVVFAGAQGDFVGLDQLNVRLPRTLIGRGDVEISLTVDGVAANSVRVSIR